MRCRVHRLLSHFKLDYDVVIRHAGYRLNIAEHVCIIEMWPSCLLMSLVQTARSFRLQRYGVVFSRARAAVNLINGRLARE